MHSRAKPHPDSGSEDSGMIRVCSAQIMSVWEDPDRTLAKAESLIRYAADCSADIICFPEQFATGWDPHSSKNIQGMEASIISSLQRFARKSSIALLGSVREATETGPRNTSVVIGNDGRILTTYSKIHLFSPAKENEFFLPGTEPGVFPLGGLLCGVAICYDLRFPELFRIYARMGVQVVFIPAAWPERRIHHWELFIRARAAENQMYIVGINTTGTTPVDRYPGASMTADPSGSIIQRGGEAEQLIFSDLYPSVVDETQRTFPVGRDWRDDLFHSLQSSGH
ncbi:MAG: omega-amidase [Methanoregula sp. SKADARSKE-2]|nr:MAG: omega-amidase [Methanoregula sp. SKADARSKE-2]